MRSFTWPAEGGADDGVAQLLVGEGHGSRALRGLGPQGVARSGRPCRRRPARRCSGPPPRRRCRCEMRPCVEELLRAEVLLLGVGAVGVRALDLGRLPAGPSGRRRRRAASAAPGSARGPRAPARRVRPSSTGTILTSGRPAATAIADVDEDLGHPALDLGADRDLFEREERAHGVDRALHAAGLDGHDVRLDRLRPARAPSSAAVRGHIRPRRRPARRQQHERAPGRGPFRHCRTPSLAGLALSRPRGPTASTLCAVRTR